MKANRTTNTETSRKANSETDGKTNMNKNMKADGKADRAARTGGRSGAEMPATREKRAAVEQVSMTLRAHSMHVAGALFGVRKRHGASRTGTWRQGGWMGAARSLRRRAGGPQ